MPSPEAEYAAKHHIFDVLSDAAQSLIEHKPSDPVAHLMDFFQKWNSNHPDKTSAVSQ
jgi:hypothetical protein